MKSLLLPRGRPLGHYLSGVTNLRRHLAATAHRSRLTEAQARLIVGRLAARAEFEDPYGTPGQAQLDAYVAVVRSVAPYADEDLVLRTLPRHVASVRREASPR